MDMTEQEKYEMMYRECKRYGKNWAVAGRVHKEIIQTRMPKGTYWDFGAGNGSCAVWLTSTGRTALGVDIASNACSDSNVRQADLRDPSLDLVQRDCGVCIDVMEHIPEDDVGIVLANIANAVRDRVYFHIALGEDKDGDEFGVQLHLTQQSVDWWDFILGTYFASVEEVNFLSERFVTFICEK